jgi:beta-1,4-N-acetylglucosaminyltransferase
MKIAIVCSHGGHYTEILQIFTAFEGHDVFIATYHSSREVEIHKKYRAYFTANMGSSVWNMLKGSFWALSILAREHPQVIVSLGAEIAIPFFYLGKLFGMKTIFIESWCRVESRSLTGRLVYPIADAFFVQWPQLALVYGAKAQYAGAVI